MELFDSFAFYLLMFLSPRFLTWFPPPPLTTGFIPLPTQPSIEKKGDIAGDELAARKQHTTQGCSAPRCCWHYRSPAGTCSAGALLQTWRATVLALVSSLELNGSQRCPQELPFPSTNPAGCSLWDGTGSLLGLRQNSDPAELLPDHPVILISWG